MSELLAATSVVRRIRATSRPLRVAVTATLGAMLIVLSFSHAASDPADTDQLTFALYWAGYLSAMVAMAGLCCARRVDHITRTFALLGFALFGTLPRLLRNPGGPLGSDEYAHMRQVIEAYTDGAVGHVSYQLPITQFFPGLHQWVSSVAHISGLPIYTVALVVITSAHILSIVACYQLVAALGATPRGAAAAAIIYALNPSWVLFDTSFAYETLALPLLIWCLAAAASAADRSRPHVGGNVVAGSLAALAVPIVHHLTAIILCSLLVAMMCAALGGRLRHARRGEPGDRVAPLVVIVCCALGSTAFWFSSQFSMIVAYLSPSVTRAWAQLEQLVGEKPRPSGGGGGTRGLFVGTRAPFYEVLSAIAFPVIVLGIVSVSVFVLWSQRHTIRSVVWAFAGLASLFFLSMPALFTAGGAEGVHRSWAFSFIGVAVVCGLARTFGLPTGPVTETRLGRFLMAVHRRSPRNPRAQSAIAGVLVALLMVGGMGAGQQNVSARFPGPPSVGDDARSVNPESAAVSAWVRRHAPVDTPVLADRSVSFELGSDGRMAVLAPAPDFPLWDLYMDPTPVPASVLKQLYDSRIRYLVVDARMATERPLLGYWFTQDEPGATGALLYPEAAISRFNCLPWLHATYGAGPLTVYEVDRDALIRTMAGECGIRGGR